MKSQFRKCVRGSSTAQGWFNALVIKVEYIRFQMVQSAWFCIPVLPKNNFALFNRQNSVIK